MMKNQKHDALQEELKAIENEFFGQDNEIETLKKQLSDTQEELASAKKDVVTLLETVALLTKKNKELVRELAVKTFEAWLTDDENAITE